MSRTLVVERELAGVRLMDFLARELPGMRRMQLRHVVDGGHVSVNGEQCLSDRRLRVDDVVIVAADAALAEDADVAAKPGAEPAAAALPNVLFESASTLVVDKPAGAHTVPDRSGQHRGVHGVLEVLRPGDDLRIVHRLDRDTSGCLVLAKGPDAARHWDEQFRLHRVQKTYVALVQGVPRQGAFTITAWLGPDRRRPGKVVAKVGEHPGFRDAHTEVVVRATFGKHALLELRPRTGRSHQLRVHLQSVGHPIVADRDYGGEPLLLSQLKAGYKKRTGVEERPLLERMFLHAEHITFVDADGREIAVDAPLPQDLTLALRHVERHAQRR